MLQYVWKHRLYTEADLVTTDGLPVFVIDPGISNTDAGPDFFNAKIRIGETVWVGNVEIHVRASDWMAHRHHIDKGYDSVILHVVGRANATACRTDGNPIRQAILHVPERVEANIAWLLSRDTPVSCAKRMYLVPQLYLSDWMAALLTERLERKTQDVFARLMQHAKDWNEVFYITLMRNFGFGTNSDAFEILAGSLPYKYILKHRYQPEQVEALFFGQAGLLETGAAVGDCPTDMSLPAAAKSLPAGARSLPAEDGAKVIDSTDPYLLTLRREYGFLRKKYKLKPVASFLFKKLRVRPLNFPHVRLAQAAAVWIKNDLLFSKVLETERTKDLRALFNVAPSEYWRTHYDFRAASVSRQKLLGKNATDIILINTVIPILFAYGKYKQLPVYNERALRFLEELAPERNSIITLFSQAGIAAKNAGDTQALIQLRREYCDKKKCLYCRIGFRMIGHGQ